MLCYMRDCRLLVVVHHQVFWNITLWKLYLLPSSVKPRSIYTCKRTELVFQWMLLAVSNGPSCICTSISTPLPLTLETVPVAETSLSFTILGARRSPETQQFRVKCFGRVKPKPHILLVQSYYHNHNYSRRDMWSLSFSLMTLALSLGWKLITVIINHSTDVVPSLTAIKVGLANTGFIIHW